MNEVLGILLGAATVGVLALIAARGRGSRMRRPSSVEPDDVPRQMPPLTSKRDATLRTPPPLTAKPDVSREMPQLSDLSASLAGVGGWPGTATERQLMALASLQMGEIRDLSREQASALLSARRYSEGVIHAEIGVMDGYKDERWIEAKLVDFIIRDPALRKRVIDWNRRSYARGGANVPQPKKDAHYAKVQGYLRELLKL